MRDIVAMVLAGGRVEELSVLTMRRPKAAVPFGGQYRIIDFALSGLMHADLERAGVVSLYRPSSLIEHVGIGEPWEFVGRGRVMKILPPYLNEEGAQWYRGTADAVYQNLLFVRNHEPRDVLVLSGDHVSCMDLRPFIQYHRDSDADMTMVVKSIPREQGRGRYGFAEVDHRSRVVGYEEKPEQPRSDLVSLTTYLFKTEVLIDRLTENQKHGINFQIYSEILPEMVRRDRVYAFRYDGYWSYARSVEAYHQAHMDLLGSEPPLRLKEWGVRSRQTFRGLGELPPVRFEGSSRCTESLIAPGVTIAGKVVRSVLSPGVRVEAGAVVQDSVLMHNTVVRSGATVQRAVVDKAVEIGEESRVGGLEPTGGSMGGVTVVGKGSQIFPGGFVGRDCVVEPEITRQDWSRSVVEDGTVMKKRTGDYD